MLLNAYVCCVEPNCRLMNLLSEYDPLSRLFVNVEMKPLLNLQHALTVFNSHLTGCALGRMKLIRRTDYSIHWCLKLLSMQFAMFARSMNGKCRMSNGSQKSNLA